MRTARKSSSVAEGHIRLATPLTPVLPLRPALVRLARIKLPDWRSWHQTASFPEGFPYWSE